MCCDVLVTVEPHWFILRVACVAVWLQLVPITPSHLMISSDIWVGVCTLSSSASYYLPLPPYSESGDSHAGLSRGKETQLQDTGDTGAYRHTQSYAVFSSIPSIQQRSALVCSVHCYKMSYFPGKYCRISHFASRAALHYVIYIYLLFGFGNIYWLDNKQLQQRLFKWISIKLHRYFYWLKYRYVEMMSDIIV